MRPPCSFLPAALLPLLLLLLEPVRANTEIVNFAASLRPSSSLPSPLQLARESTEPAETRESKGMAVLHPAARTLTPWALRPAPLGTAPADVCASSPCAHELWLVLDLDSAEYEKYTLRLSYAASTPTDFFVDVLDPREAAALFARPPSGSGSGETLTESEWKSESESGRQSQPQTRTKYARIRALDTGVRTPPSAYSAFLFPSRNSASAHNTTSFHSPSPHNATAAKEADVPFLLALEPLYLGVLPATALPFLLLAAGVLALAGAALPHVLAYLEEIVGEARGEKEKDFKTE
ncbi:hypothetical protein B0H17DRAFT_388946 [Mycena rosella]|uniref:Protein BIG1 n=1 Tax=Mycena rosella TaxID=1033263 RepID=A0AAD7G407_MYCRO|nr:hypothetical protein B0H17DRAFT_388946 [Mycena rosella]